MAAADIIEMEVAGVVSLAPELPEQLQRKQN
jgi:hypothetical protein